ncbi:MAG: ABC transporter ATP-binding protein [Meiothermus sp.]
MPNPLVLVDQASAVYRSLRGRPRLALEDVSLCLMPGETHALVGHNGAGKTTLLRLVLGLLSTWTGNISVLGKDPIAQRTRIMREVGVVLDGRRALEPRLSGLENLLLKASIYGIPKAERRDRAKALLDYFDLPADELVNRYSRGMRQRLILAGAILHNPRVLFLDEPTLGLDVRGWDLLLELIEQTTKLQGAVLITSQEISLIEKVSSRISILKQGKIVATGKPSDGLDILGYRARVRLKVLDPSKIVFPVPSGFSWDGESLEGPLNLAGMEELIAYLRSTGAGLAGLEQVSALESLVRGEVA